jgi:rhodanese-related sulfurtransferase
MSRRAALAVLAGVGAAGVFGAQWFNVSAEVTNGALSVQDAHAKATSGEVLLIDIRRPDEWARSGVGQGAAPLDMRRKDFVEALLDLSAGDRARPVALICARGVRSRAMTRRLREAGFTNIIDVPEGMLGSGAGPGWLKSGLPVVK